MKKTEQIRDVPFLKEIIEYWDKTRNNPYHPNYICEFDDVEFMDLPTWFIDKMVDSKKFKIWSFFKKIKSKLFYFNNWFNNKFGWFFTNGFKAIENDAIQKEESNI